MKAETREMLRIKNQVKMDHAREAAWDEGYKVGKKYAKLAKAQLRITARDYIPKVNGTKQDFRQGLLDAVSDELGNINF